MKKITFFRTAFVAVGITLAMANAFAQTQVANIAALRSTVGTLASGGTTGTTAYQITGEVVLTLQTGTTTKTYYVQDATGAIMIYDSGKKLTTTHAIGDGITNLTGTITNYQGMWELIPTVDAGASTSSGKTSTIVPQIITYDQMAANQAILVTIKNILITGASGNFSRKAYPFGVNGQSIDAQNPQLYPYADQDLIGQPVPTTPVDITGFVLIYGTKVEYVPRSAADIVASVSSGINYLIQDRNFSVNKGSILVSATAGELIEIYNSTGNKLVNKIANQGINVFSVNTKGVILVKAGNRIGKLIL